MALSSSYFLSADFRMYVALSLRRLPQPMALLLWEEETFSRSSSSMTLAARAP